MVTDYTSMGLPLKYHLNFEINGNIYLQYICELLLASGMKSLKQLSSNHCLVAITNIIQKVVFKSVQPHLK